MSLNKLIFALLLITASFAAEKIITANQIEISISETNPIIGGEPLTIRVHSYLPNIQYIYATLESGGSVILDKKSEITWSKPLSIPDYLLEGKKLLTISIVLEKTNLEYPTNQNITLEHKGSITQINLNTFITAIEKTTAEKKVAITTTPEQVQPGQKLLLKVHTAYSLQKASLIYLNKNYNLSKEADTLWSAEIIASTNLEAKLFLLDTDNNLHTNYLALPIFNPEQSLLNSLVTTQTPTPASTSSVSRNYLSIKGNKTVIFINKTKEGEAPGFTEEHTREESLNLDINGRENSVNVEAKVFSTTQENVDKKEDMRIRLFTENWEAYMGDMSETISQNELTLKNKNLTGFKFSYHPENDYYMVLHATQRGTDRLEYIYGNDSQGPYIINASPVLLGSEKIYVDTILQERDKNYTLDYKSGQIVFKNSLIAKNQIIKVTYESENSAYNNKFTALHLYKDYDWLALGITALQSRDALDNANTVSGSSLAPTDKKLYDLTAKLRLGYFGLDLEKAKSEIKSDLLNRAATINSAEAGYAKVYYDNQQSLKFNVTTKKTDDDFEAIGNKDLPKGLKQDTSFMEIQSSENMKIRADKFNEEYKTDSLTHNRHDYYKFYLAENLLPETHYWTKQSHQSITPLNPSSNLVEITREFHGEYTDLSKTLTQNYRIGLKASREKLADSTNLLKYTNAETYGGYLKTEGFQFADVIIGSDHTKKEYLNQDKQLSLNATRDETYTRINIYPDNRFRLGGAYRTIKDTAEGPSDIADLDFIIAPHNDFRSNGQYTLESLIEQFVSADYRVQKQKGSFSTRWQPDNAWKITLKYAPNVSIVRAPKEIVNSFVEVRNTGVDWSPFSWGSLKYNMLNTYSFTRDSSQIENNIIKTEDKNTTQLAVLKVSPLDKIDIELKYRIAQIIDNDLNDINTSNIYYTEGSGQEREKGISFYTRPLRELLLETGYSTEFIEMEYLNEPSLNIKTTRDQYLLDTKYRIDQYWTLHTFGTYLKITDHLVSENNITYAYSPGIGISYRITQFKAIYDYTKTESVLGTEILNHKHVGGVDYDYNQYIHLNISIEQLISEKPKYQTTSMMAKFSATF